jgi:hypothetical protein
MADPKEREMKTIMSMTKGVVATIEDMTLYAHAEPWNMGGYKRP